jgi:hypothetical protein
MRISQVLPIFQAAFRARKALHLIGAPGVGKSSIVEQFVAWMAKQTKQPVGLSINHLSTLDAPDVRGFMIPHKMPDGTLVSKFTLSPLIPQMGVNVDVFMPDGTVVRHWDPEAANMPLPKLGLVFLDEYLQSGPEVQKPATRFLYEHQVGDHALQEGWVVWAASNRVEDRSGASKRMMFEVNRTGTILVEPDVDSWAGWAAAKGVHPFVIAFAKFKPGLVFSGKAPEKDGPFCSPRSLVNAEETMRALHPDGELLVNDETLAIAAAFMGEGTAAELSAFLRKAADLPSFEEITKDPVKARVPKSEAFDVLHAVSQLLAARVTKATAKAVMVYLQRLPREFQISGLTAAISRDASIMSTPEFSAWVSDGNNQKIVMSAISGLR